MKLAGIAEEQGMMRVIYFDNSATSLPKPPQVAEAVADAINHFGNPGRSFYEASTLALKTIHETRSAVAGLVSLNDPMGVAFTSSATESLNLVLRSLIKAGDSVITTVQEHNSVLRPLYNMGCGLKLIPCDPEGNLLLDDLEQYLDDSTRLLVCSHASNVTGRIADVTKLRRFCKMQGIIFILDVSQTLGSVEITADMADILCFTGHKALFGPQGTGGIIVKDKLDFSLVKTGGSGSDSFLPHQRLEMPDIFEAGTMNGHGLAGLKEGVGFVRGTGVLAIKKHCSQLRETFIRQVAEIKGVKLYGATGDLSGFVPIVSLNIKGVPAEDLAVMLWDRWKIATRAGVHCAPLIHGHFGTAAQGMVRFSFGYFSTLEDISIAVNAIKIIARSQ